MLACAAFCLALLPLQAPKSTFQRLFPKPTGMNGYEELARADDLATKLQIGMYQSWLPPERRPKREPLTEEQKKVIADEEEMFGKPDPKIEALRRRLEELTLLQVRTEEAQVGAPIVTLVRQALQKPMSRPVRDDTMEFVSLIQLRRLFKLLEHSAYVEFSRGRPAQGVEMLRTNLKLADALSPFGTMDVILSVGFSSWTFAAFDQHLDQCSLSDLQQIPELCQSLLGQNRLRDALALEERWSDRKVDESLKEFLTAKPAEIEDIGDEQIKAMVREIAKLSAAQKLSFVADVKRKAHLRFTSVLNVLSTGESEWIAQLEPVSEKEAEIKSLADTSDEFARWFSPISPRTMAIRMLQYRTQLRLLDLHSRIRAFRWIHGRLPATLAEAGVSNSADPLSKAPFAYEVQSESTYRLYSKGITETGEIDLKYVRPNPDLDREKP